MMFPFTYLFFLLSFVYLLRLLHNLMLLLLSLVNNDGTWEEQDGYIEKVITDIKAGETKEYKITLSWNKGNNNLGEKDNTVEIIKTGNIPGFKEQNVDDNSSTARVLINVSTGSVPWPLVIALIALVGLEGVTLSYARVLTNKETLTPSPFAISIFFMSA